MTKTSSDSSLVKLNWRHALLLAILIGSLAYILSGEPYGQGTAYHRFVDRRAFFGVSNFFDVMSNIPFLLVGIAGVRFCIGNDQMGLRSAWIVFFAGVAVISAGSAYYHFSPNNGSLVWDRLPMTIGFMGLFVALLAEYVSVRLGRLLLIPALLAGLGSVLYWHWMDDLRFYFWIQLIPLLMVPAAIALFKPKYSHQWLLLVALAFYLLAKFSEMNDQIIFAYSHRLFSGHSLKHLLAAASCLFVLMMLKTRRAIA